VETHKKIKGHPNVILFIKSVDVVNYDLDEESKSNYLIVEELCSGGNLSNIIDNKGNYLTPPIVRNIMNQMI